VIHQIMVNDCTARHLRGGPVGPPSRWAATSNVEVGQTTYPVNSGTLGGGRVRHVGTSTAQRARHSTSRHDTTRTTCPVCHHRHQISLLNAVRRSHAQVAVVRNNRKIKYN